MTALPTKTCKVCGIDLRSQRRVTNPSGDYFCPTCWQRGIVASRDAVVSPENLPPNPIGAARATPPVVRVVRSELEPARPARREAVVGDLKKGAINGLFRAFSKGLVFAHVIAAVGLTRKFFPETNNGVIAIITLTSAIAAIIEADMLARLLDIDRWVDAEMIRSTTGKVVIIGFVLAYALAIFLAVIGA